MLTIAVLGAAAVFILLLAVAKASGLLTAGVDLSARVQQYRTPVRQQRRARVSTGSAFWDDIMRSRFSTWARTGANKFGYLLPKKNWFELKAQQANLPVTGQEYMMLVGGSALFIFVLMAIATLQLSEPLLFAVGWVVFASLYVQFKANRRMKQFTNQLGDAIAMMSNAIKSGFTFQQAMDIVAKEIKGPISEEFVRALNEIQLGVTLEEALEGICQRIKDDDFEMVAMSVVIQRQVGGNLSQILDTVGETIRDRIKLRGEIKSLTAEGVISGWTIALLPVIVGAFCNAANPDYFKGMLDTDFGKYLGIACLVSEIIGGLVIRWIINVKI
ncbi:type II secretion system F family protein [uncultured Phascolarctobacterium sp.]|jgi:tight adherence protein B|uniref:type II secretion system F family protein n=1 Tax=uncultured Phascolarctobacterium sp. TaxID=512296 RepID=UPI0025FE4566|nr:type II secretion system F family protein [uncultured Phascolarctobacterium sp.]